MEKKKAEESSALINWQAHFKFFFYLQTQQVSIMF